MVINHSFILVCLIFKSPVYRLLLIIDPSIKIFKNHRIIYVISDIALTCTIVVIDEEIMYARHHNIQTGHEFRGY